eukprot:TRINITY_DN13188_c0_g1_i1.p1 TRINITY_DN13188_c0_g1~~TRINITY_DN13188_c0_g1_i1.p1  ORF type:complete len:742 (+),score=89.72 TRINITY_DN13188_c0_g1_i1:36-2261(+)
MIAGAARFVFLVVLILGVSSQTPSKVFKTRVLVGDYVYGTNEGPVRGAEINWFISYSDTYNFRAKTGYERIKWELDSGGDQVYTELEVFERNFTKYQWCKDDCGWDDRFGLTPMPQLWCETSDPTASTGQNGFTANELYFATRTTPEDPNYSRVWCLKSNLRPVYAEIKLKADNIDKRITFDMSASFDSSFDPAIELDIGPDCEYVDTECLRLDVVYVLDHSSSMIRFADQTDPDGPFNHWPTAVNFVVDLTRELNISPQRVMVGANYFSTQNKTITDILDDRRTAMDEIGDSSSDNPNRNGGCCTEFTSIVRGVWGALDMLATQGRDFTKKLVIVISDGNGNRPCFDPSNSDWEDNDEATGPNANNCGTSCCRAHHNNHMLQMYDEVRKYWDSQYPRIEWPQIFSIAVGTEEVINQETQSLVSQNNAQNEFRVESFDEINNLLSRLRDIFACDTPGSTPCPNDCRPGGFCCGGACECTLPCETSPLFNTECQSGRCKVDNTGAQCVKGDPVDSICQEGKEDQCRKYFCLADVGCSNETLNIACNDGNNCTADDVCVDGVCTGVDVEAGVSCDSDNLCVNATCNAEGECVANATIVCSSPDPCKAGFCRPSTGLCELKDKALNAQCAEDEDDDRCTVFICAEPEEEGLTALECVEATRDEEGLSCGGGDDTTAIIAGTIAGVCALCLAIIIGIIVALLIMKAASAKVEATAAAFGVGDKIELNPVFVAAGKVKTSALYNGS